MAEELSTPIARDDFTHVDLTLVEFNFSLGQLRGVMAAVAFGREDGSGHFDAVRHIETRFSRQQILNNLTTSERDALVSIRAKIINAAKGLV